MRLVTQRNGDLPTYFDKIYESEDSNNKSSLQQILINNHQEVNRGVAGGHLSLKNKIGFCVPFKIIRKGPGFELELRTTNKN